MAIAHGFGFAGDLDLDGAAKTFSEMTHGVLLLV
jgi:hypothetical protein